MSVISRLILVQPDTLLRESLRFGFEREGVAVAACGAGDAFDPDLFDKPVQLVIAGGRTGDEARSVLALLRAVLSDAALKPPVLYVGNGIPRSQALDEGATEFLGQPVFVRDAVTVARLLASRKPDHPTVLTGNLGEHFGLFYLVRAISALGRRGVLTLVRGMRRGELRFWDGEVTSAQVGPLHGLAALHQLLLWTEGRFELRPEDVVRRQQIPLSPSELFADAERFLSEIVAVAGELSLSAGYAVDGQQLARVSGRIPPEVIAVLKLFDGSRTLADVVEDCQFRVFETLRIANRLSELGLIQLRSPARADERDRSALAIEEWKVGERASRGPGYVVVSKQRAGGGPGGAGGHGGPGGLTTAEERRQASHGGHGRTHEDRAHRARPGATRRESRDGAPGAPPPTDAAAAQSAPLEVDWAQVIPGAVGSELAVSPVVPSSAAAGEISVAAAPVSAAAPRERIDASAPADPSGRVARTEPAREEPILLTRKATDRATARAGTEAPARPAMEAVIEPVTEPVREPVIELVKPAGSVPTRAPTKAPAPARLPSFAEQPRKPTAPPKARPPTKPGRAPSHPKTFSAEEEAFFAEGAELAEPQPESFDDLDDGYQPQGFWRRLFRSPHRPVTPRKPRG
jgi:hypothetical protein